MNIRRGLFRLWVVFSVLWVSGIGYTSIMAFYADPEEYIPAPAPSAQTSSSATTGFNLVAALTQTAEGKFVPPAAGPAPSSEPLDAASMVEAGLKGDFSWVPKPEVQPAAPSLWDAPISFWASTLYIVFGPPLALLIAYFLARWVSMGFRNVETRDKATR